jgi:hypothetical protein
MNHVWDFIPSDEKQRVLKLEILDEVEELNMIQAHYCLVWACSNREDLDLWFD